MPKRQAASRPTTQRPQDQIKVEPGSEKRLANILKKALNTRPPRKQEAHIKKK